jgi:hypothetical protein
MRRASSQHIRRNHDRGPLRSNRNIVSGLSGLFARQTGWILSCLKTHRRSWIESTNCDGGNVRKADFPVRIRANFREARFWTATDPLALSVARGRQSMWTRRANRRELSRICYLTIIGQISPFERLKFLISGG